MSVPAIPDTRNALVLPHTGEVIELEDVEQVAAALRGLREFQRTALTDARRLLEDVLAVEMERQGTKTLRVGGMTAKLVEKRETTYDVERLRKSLSNAGLPEDRIEELIKTEIVYKVDGRVARSLAAGNEKYARALKRYKSVVETGRYVSVE